MYLTYMSLALCVSKTCVDIISSYQNMADTLKHHFDIDIFKIFHHFHRYIDDVHLVVWGVVEFIEIIAQIDWNVIYPFC